MRRRCRLACQIGGVWGAQETEAVLQYFQRAVTEYAVAFLGFVLEQGKDQVLLAHATGVFDFVGNRHFNQFCDG